MDLKGETIIPAPRAAVWQALNDPEVLRQSIPGCETITKTSDTEFTAKVVAKVGPVKASFTGAVTLSDIDPPNGYRISGEGKGGAAGFAKGGAVVRLEDAPEGTKLIYTVDAQVGGKLAQIGSRLIEGTARSLSADFFQRFANLVAPPKPEPEPEPEPEAEPELVVDDARHVAPEPNALVPDEAASMDATVRETQGLPPWAWVGGTIVLIILLVIAGLNL